MQSGFQFITTEEQDVIAKVKRLRELNLKVIPVLDKDGRIIKVQNLSQLRSILPLDAVLMAGGKGERLRPLTEKTPKPLLPVGDKCIIDHNIDRLISYGVEHISVTCNYLKEQLYEHFEKPRSGVKVDCVTESKFLGTIGSIKFVETFYNDTILVMNSDLFTDINYEDFYLHFKEHNADMSVAAVPYTVSVPYGIMDLDGRNLKGIPRQALNARPDSGRRILSCHPPDGRHPQTRWQDYPFSNQRYLDRYRQSAGVSKG